jgi:hypothetical protein
MKVVLIPAVREYMENLSQVMYKKHYFSYMETADAYVDTLVDEIERSLPLYPSHEASPYFNRYGKDLRYVLIRRSKHTQWYAFFNTYRIGEEWVYVVRFISNNHVIGKHLRPSPV